MDSSLSITAQTTPHRARNESVDELRHHRGHERRSERRSERREDRDDRREAFAELKVKIEQTLTAQIRPPAEVSETQTPEAASAADGEMASSSVEIELKARLRVSGGDFGSALQSFAEALFSALQTLYGAPQSAQTPATSVSPAVLSGATTDPVETPIDAPVAAETPSTDPVVAEPVVAAPVGTEPAATAAGATGSLSIRLRLAYTSFDSQLGPLTQRLAQPGVGDAVPAVGAMFGDLAERFGALRSAVAGAAEAHPNLAKFLQSLAQAFSGGDAAAPAVETATAPASATPASTSTSSSSSASTSTSLSIRFSAVMRYEQAACNSQPALAVA